MKSAAQSKSKTKPVPRKRAPRKEDGDHWQLRLYIAGQSPNSLAALDNLKKMCAQRLDGKYRIEVIDLLQKPQLAKDDQIVAIPTLVRRLPAPVKKIIGNLSKNDSVLVGLDLKPMQTISNQDF